MLNYPPIKNIDTRTSEPIGFAAEQNTLTALSGHETDYHQWRRLKLADYPESSAQLMVSVTDPNQLSGQEKQNIIQLIAKTNLVFFSLAANQRMDRESLKNMGLQLGLARLDAHLCADEDAITTLRDQPGHQDQQLYIPYTNKPMNWHTDGYYNEPNHAIRAFILYCIQDAAHGGENYFIDHERLYIHLRDHRPEFIAPLSAPDAMLIPENRQENQLIRAECSVPVFALDPLTQKLQMRYTSRPKNIVWKADALTQAALAYLRYVINNGEVPIFTHRLTPGEGVICHNVLHKRGGFQDNASTHHVRTLLRARYYDAVQVAK